MGVLENIGYILIGCIGIISIFLIILAVLEKNLKIKFLRGKVTRNEFYIKKIASVNINYPKQALKILGNTAKVFFKEAFHLKGYPEYSELEKFFQKKNNKKATEFCETMTNFLYSGKEIEKKDAQLLVNILAEIISSNKILSSEEKKQLDEKSLEKDKSRKKQTIIKEIIQKVKRKK